MQKDEAYMCFLHMYLFRLDLKKFRTYFVREGGASKYSLNCKILESGTSTHTLFIQVLLYLYRM
jgi:hypothetical protein